MTPKIDIRHTPQGEYPYSGEPHYGHMKAAESRLIAERDEARDVARRMKRERDELEITLDAYRRNNIAYHNRASRWELAWENLWDDLERKIRQAMLFYDKYKQQQKRVKELEKLLEGGSGLVNYVKWRRSFMWSFAWKKAAKKWRGRALSESGELAWMDERAFAAEKRVKELEEALKDAKRFIERHRFSKTPHRVDSRMIGIYETKKYRDIMQLIREALNKS